MASKNEVDFKDSDVLLVQIQTHTDNYVVPNWEKDPENPKKLLAPSVLGRADQGPFEIETTGRSVRDILLDVEPEPEAWERAVKRHQRALERFRLRLENDSSFKSMPESERQEQIEAELKLWGVANSPARQFFESEGRGRLPLKGVTVLENRGPRFDDYKAQTDSDREFMELMKEKLKRDLMKEMVAEKAIHNEKKK